MPNGTYGGVRGERKSPLLDYIYGLLQYSHLDPFIKPTILYLDMFDV